MRTECNLDLFGFAPVEGRRVEAAFDAGLATSDAGALLLGAADRAIGLIGRLAACFEDVRCQALVEHQVATLVGQRVFGIALGYEDLVDHDHLRHDPVMAVLAGKLAAKRRDCAPVAGKSTLNRLELSRPVATLYHKISYRPAAIEGLLVSLFVEAHRTPPAQIVFDLDATDDPLHGHQEGRFFHGYYDCYCYLPLYVFCGRHLLAAKLRRSNIDASAGAVEEVARIVAQIRQRWPDVRILLRADSGFAREALMAWCEANGVDFLFGLQRNPRLVAELEGELAAAQAEAETKRRPARRYKDFMWATQDSWSCRRRVVGKAEWMAGREDGGNPRFVVTSLARREVRARRLYERLYCARGEMENRIKSLPPRRRGSASSICSPTAPRPGPCAPTSSGSGSPPWPTRCSARSAASASPIPASPGRAAAPSASSCSRSPRACASACAASASPCRPPAPASPSSPPPTNDYPPPRRKRHDRTQPIHNRGTAPSPTQPPSGG